MDNEPWKEIYIMRKNEKCCVSWWKARRKNASSLFKSCREELAGVWHDVARHLINYKRIIDGKEYTGHWIEGYIPMLNEPEKKMPIEVCDQCKTFFPVSATGYGYRYCPQCGAKMLEQDEEERELNI